MMVRMETAMTGEGERQAAVQRRRFWLILAGIGAVGMVTGALYSLHTHGAIDLAALPAPAIVAAVGALVATFLYGSWRFFTAVDELELQDNLWASAVGLYVYSVLFPTWWVLGHLDVDDNDNP